MRDPEDRHIGETLYRVTPLPAGKGLAVLTRASKVLGASLAKVATLEEGLAVWAAAAGEVAQRLEAADLEFVCRTFAEHTQLVGESAAVPLKGCFDMHFAGRYDELYEWLRFSAEVNFGPLLAGLKRRAPAAASAAAAK